MSQRFAVHRFENEIPTGEPLSKSDEELRALKFAAAYTEIERLDTIVIDHQSQIAFAYVCTVDHDGEAIISVPLIWVPEPQENPEPRFPRSTEIQTLIFDRSLFDRTTAKEWAEDHDFRYGDRHIHETNKSVRIRQRDPAEFESWTFRTIALTDGIKAVIGVPGA